MNATPNIAGQLFAVPLDQADAPGMHIGGGWHRFTNHPDHGRVVLMPAEGDYSSLCGLGFRSLGIQAPSDAQIPPDGANTDMPTPLTGDAA
jgi:hypothetical protein